MTPTMQLFTSGSQVCGWCLPGADGCLRGTFQCRDREERRVRVFTVPYLCSLPIMPPEIQDSLHGNTDWKKLQIFLYSSEKCSSEYMKEYRASWQEKTILFGNPGKASSNRNPGYSCAGVAAVLTLAVLGWQSPSSWLCPAPGDRNGCIRLKICQVLPDMWHCGLYIHQGSLHMGIKNPCMMQSSVLLLPTGWGGSPGSENPFTIICSETKCWVWQRANMEAEGRP